MLILFSSLIMCLCFHVTYQQVISNDFDLLFFVSVFGVILCWYLARRVYQDKYKSWYFDQRYYRPPFLVVDTINTVVLLLIIWFDKLAKSVAWPDAYLVTVGSTIVIMLALQLLFTQEPDSNRSIN